MSARQKIVGMLGGGQLGRMSALAGAPLGLVTHLYSPDAADPASQVTPHHMIAAYEDREALAKFASLVDVITYEFENIPVETVRYLETLKPVYPSSHVLAIAQERIAEKTAMNAYDLPTTRFAAARSGADVVSVMDSWGVNRCILKTTRFGYDGKGQTLVKSSADADSGFSKLKADIVIVEDVVDFSCEISVIVARDTYGQVGSYAPSLNVHKDHILHTSTVPAPLPRELLKEAQQLAETLAKKIDLVGVLGVEMFVTNSNGLLINEIAPRPHNSGHWTMDACACSQFEQHMRAVAGMPLGDFSRHSDAVMTNLLGEDILQVPALLKNPHAHVHDYGKAEAKPGRKMGHVTVISR
ncbi:MAG: 5-(carboxyamino)imidazole ribonucleotide synthase [Proteobacteria bacterium]|nr:5-(carboxyamino)imidazole ribonucleotide synthase [Pseudomonadota bacterium]